MNERVIRLLVITNIIIIIFFIILPSVVVSRKRSWFYPDVKRDDYSYRRFDTEIPDPYHWLEDSKSDATKSFVRQQNAVTNGYISRNGHYEQIKSNFQQLYNYTSYGIPTKHGQNYYLNQREPQQNQGVIYSLKTLADPDPQVFLDPNKLSPDGSVSLSFMAFSPDGEWCAYGTNTGGSDWIVIKVKHVRTRRDLGDELMKIKFSAVEWNKNNNGFFYAYYDTYNGSCDGTDTEIPVDQKLYYHRLNTTQDQDIMIKGFPGHPKLLTGNGVVSEDGKTLHVFPMEDSENTAWMFAKFDPDFNETFQFEFKPIVKNYEKMIGYIGSDANCTYVLTNHKAPNYRLACVDLENPSPDNWKDVIPNGRHLLASAFVVNKNLVVCNYLVDVVNKLKIYSLETGEHLYDVDTPIGQIYAIGGRMDSTEFFYKYTSFLSPGIIYHYDLRVIVVDAIQNQYQHKNSIYKQSTIHGLDMSKFETKQIFYGSKDGTKVPMFIVSRKNLKRTGQNPAWLYAYGGFNINIQPEYNPLALFWVIHFEGLFCVANIRGGGEYGEEWHRQGMRLNKQNVFDDFAAAGEWLIENNWTSRDYLTINGRSNGGLLAGASSNQRADIFGSAIAEVGVMDMLKFPLYTIGYAWMGEYGNPVENETEFRYIHGYSPLHNIHENMTQYPNMLVMTADHDDRVVPAHSYKFISELQFRLGKRLFDTPLLIRIDANSGHGGGKPVSKWIEQYTDTMCFLLNSTPIQYKP